MKTTTPVGYTNGRLILRTADENSAAYVGTYYIDGTTYRADALVYADEGEWKVMVSVKNMDNCAEVFVRTQTCEGWTDAAKRAYHFCAYAKNTGEGVDI